MKKLLIVLFGALIFQGYVFAESWEERAASKTPWSSDFPDDPACWNTSVEWNTVNPWVVGIGAHFLYEDYADCYRVCAKNNTCYQEGWMDEDAASATCTSSSSDSLRNILRGDGTTSFLGPSQYARSPCK